MTSPDWAEERAQEIVGGYHYVAINHKLLDDIASALRAARDRGLEEAAQDVECDACGEVNRCKECKQAHLIRAFKSEAGR